MFVKEYLEEKYNPELVFLYGSFATKTATKVSDIDCICFAEIEHFVHDSSVLNDNILDCWIYPINKVNDIDLMVHIIPCEVLIDKKNISNEIINKIINKRKEEIVEMNNEEKDQLIGWINKMLIRCTEDTLESNYRYAWLITDFPELYCKFTNQYYDGPIKTINKIKEQNEIYYKYEIVTKQKNVQILKELYSQIIRKNI